MEVSESGLLFPQPAMPSDALRINTNPAPCQM